MTPGEIAADRYMERWAYMRDQAMELADEATRAGPLGRRRLRNQAALCDQYAVILHHAAWRELHPDSPEALDAAS